RRAGPRRQAGRGAPRTWRGIIADPALLVSFPRPNPRSPYATPRHLRRLPVRRALGARSLPLQDPLPARADRRPGRPRPARRAPLARPRPALPPPRPLPRLRAVGPGAERGGAVDQRRRQDHALRQALRLLGGGPAVLRPLRGPGARRLQHGPLPRHV